MGRFVRGDVILAPVPFDERRETKTRPAVVISARENGDVCVCPVSSRPPADAPCVPLALEDFSEGGLDLFSESFVLTSKVVVLRAGDVIGLKGRLTVESISEIGALVPRPSSSLRDNKNGSRSRRR
ncbi:MAG: type II toxin-antitoxin system PemK/MazF family toxin [Methanoregula sp.]|nr:type II toxin-antitoxin system PemK/MazF family toxin [Methanoregula sp.]